MPRLIQFFVSVSLVGLPAFGQVHFDTFPKIAEMPYSTELQRQTVGEFHEFLWQHWVGKQRAIAQICSKSKEGSPTLVTYVIAPDERERWAITEIFQSSGWTDKGLIDLAPSVHVAYNLEVVEELSGSSVKMISNPKSPFPKSYLLRIRRPNGQESTF